MTDIDSKSRVTKSSSPANPTYEPWSERSVLAAILLALFLMLSVEVWHSRSRQSSLTVMRAPASELEFRINVNEANVVELLHLPNIGPALAEKILREREEHGAYSNLEDLRRVPGIGPKTLDSIGPYLRWPKAEAMKSDGPSR